MSAQQALESRAVSVPFLDLSHMHGPLKARLLDEIGELFDSGAFINGAAVAEFESAFASYCDAAHCVGLASGLDALRLGLLAVGLEPGDEVIVPAMTFVATLEAVTQAGGVPVVVDISADDYGLDVAATARAVGGRTRAVMPVHLYGQMSDMQGVRRLAAERLVHVLEDACQAHGAERDGLRAGASGSAAAFSFYPGKNLGAAGDAGALVTADEATATYVRALREHGQTAKYVHRYEGYTARLDTLQAVVLSHKLPFLDEWNRERRAAAGFYSTALDGVGDLALPPVPKGSSPVWHLYVVRTAHPDGLAHFLRERGVGTGRHYPEPVHLTGAYAGLGYGPGDFPVAEALAGEALSLPIFPGIAEAQLEKVVESIRAFFDG
jgi:dTDP-4-amino-4,6-dideoxygalactose transaminase